MDNWGEWPDFVEDVVSGVVWMLDPHCPGPAEMWVRGESYRSKFTNLLWHSYTKREGEIK